MAEITIVSVIVLSWILVGVIAFYIGKYYGMKIIRREVIKAVFELISEIDTPNANTT
jgi:uncharacterized membrane protein YbhN (UPF0104 family)